MMEPLQNDTALDDALDSGAEPGLAEATEALEGLMEETGRGGQAGAAAETPAGPSPAAQPGAPNRYDRRAYQEQQKQSWAKRRAHEQADYRRALEQRQQMQAQVAQQNETMKAVLEYLKALKGPEEAPPDSLDPRFPQWLQEQMAKAQGEQFKPVLDWVTRQQQAEEQARQAREEQEQQAAVAGQITTAYQNWEREYVEAVPEAHGFHERFESMRSILANSFAGMGHDLEQAQRMADAHLFQIGHHAAERGENPVAAIDAWQIAFARQFGVQPIDPGEDPYAVWNGNGGANGNGHPPQNETARLAAVQERTKPAASQAARVQPRATGTRSELVDLYRGGEQDHRKLHAAALRDSHGDMAAAAEALAALVSQ